MANATLRKLVVEYGGAVGGERLSNIMTHLQKYSGFLQTALAIPANGNWYHKYKKISALPTISFVEIGASTTDSTVNEKLAQIDIKSLKALMSEPDDVCENWPTGVSGYFSEHYPQYVEAFGQKISTQVFYGLDSTFGDVQGFRGIHETAKANSKVVYQAGGSSGSRTSIIAVKFDPVGCGLLFNPKMVTESGQFITVEVVNGGKIVLEITNTTTGAKKAVYQAYFKSPISLLMTTAYDVATITQLDATHLPTAPYMDALIDAVKGNTNDTILYTSRIGRRHIRTLKTTALQMGVMDKNYDIQVDFWNGVPIVLDENISEAETAAID